MNSNLTQLQRNLEALEKEKRRLVEQNGTYSSYEEQRGLDVYTVRTKNENSARIQELNERIRDIKKAIERESNRLDHEARIAYFEEEQRDRQERYDNAKYSYESGGKMKKTNNRALAARYDAQHRFFGLSKFKQAYYKLNGQYARYEKLWNRVDDKNREQVADELDSLFGGKHAK